MSLDSDLKRLGKISREAERKLNPSGVYTVQVKPDQSQEEAIAEYERENNIKITDQDLLIILNRYDSPSDLDDSKEMTQSNTN